MNLLLIIAVIVAIILIYSGLRFWYEYRKITRIAKQIPENQRAAIEWMQSDEGKKYVGGLLIKEAVKLEDYEAAAIVRDNLNKINK